MEKNKVATSFDIGVYVGLAIGLAIGLLFVPQSGIKTRSMLREKILDIQEKAGVAAEKLR